MQDNTYEIQLERYNRALEAKKKYELKLESDSTQLDKYLFLISGSIFSLMIAFVDKIIPLKTAQYTWAFILSLISISLTICLTIISYKMTIKATRALIEDMDECMRKYSDPEQSYKKSKFINCISGTALILTILSIFLLVSFITVNILCWSN